MLNTNDILYVGPAYGRVYTTEEQVKADWLGGKDFKIHHGPYLSVRDYSTMLGDGWIFIAYKWGPIEVKLPRP